MTRVRPWWVIGLTALLAAVLALGIDRGITALGIEPTPTVSNALPPQEVIVRIATPQPTLAPSPMSRDEEQQRLSQLEQQIAQHRSSTLVLKAVLQVAMAREAMELNDVARADSELAEARASLDEAFNLVPEVLKPQIDKERLEIGRIRSELEINPSGLDGELNRMRDRLLSLIAAQPE